jgi:MYXO-CTERM domain-containing protein
MSSPLSLHFLVAAATLVFNAGLGQTAWAKPCTTDSDCGAGYQCSLAPTKEGSSGIGGTTGSSGADAAVPALDLPTMPSDGGAATKTAPVDAGLSIPVPSTGTCEAKPIVCSSTADCPADFECEKAWITSTSPPCRGDASCATPPPQTSETGTCRAVPRACASSADCPAPLVCQSQGGGCTGGASVGPDGVVTTLPETCTEGKSVCTYVPTICTADSGCADAYQCVKVSEGSSCSGSSGVCNRSADGSVTCSTPEPPVCTSHVVMNCMPKQIACGACPSGWSCFDYSNFSGSVPGWTPDASGKACLPDGLVLAVQGHAAGGGSSDSAGADNGGVSTALRADAGLPGAAEAGAPGIKTPPSENGPSPGADAGTEGLPVAASKDEGCGCTLGGSPSSPTSPWLVLALAGLVVRVARRRR